MKPNIRDAQRTPAAGDFTLADNLAQLVPAGELIQHTLEAVQTLFWTSTSGTPTPVISSALNPRVLLTLLSYSYTTGVFASDRIAERCESDEIFHYLSLGIRFAGDRIRLFRGHNSELVKRCLAFVLRRAWATVTQENPKAMPSADCKPAIDNNAITSFRTIAWSQREAERRFSKAIQSDHAISVRSVASIHLSLISDSGTGTRS